MTVEQPALPRYAQTKPCDDHTYAQVKEITGITDRQLIHEAVSACTNNEGKFEVSQVVNMLIADEGAKSKSNKKVIMATDKMAITYHKNAGSKDSADAVANYPQGSANAIKKSKGVIDLTNVSDTNESDDIQKAIAASLADSGSSMPPTQETSGILGGQVSREEQDISRVLEQSLIESKAGTKRKRGDIWFVDPLNPHERKRTDDWPIGLKNVGNTCWFSAVIQSLFHLKKFRHLVLTYQHNKQPQGSVEEKRNLRFMQELRHLFALMVGSRRKYVDPSKSVDILKEAFASSVVNNTGVSDSQQDVSEFQHKLLEWLEDAFKSTSRPSSPAEGSVQSPKCSNNPMVDLFYGQYRADGMNEGKSFRNEENFGQFPLQVNGFRDIHESLEAATAHREIEAVSEDATQKSGQELWFTRLPPVLTFELSRFQFNQHLGRPEKIHNKIEFPQVIYMDRYMDCNREETRERRERAKKLKEELVILQARLDKFINYGSGVKRFPLQDVLLYALEFAKTQPEHARRHTSVSQDVEMESPSPSHSMLVDSPVKSPIDVAMATMTSPTPLPAADITLSPSVRAQSPALPIPDVTMSPAPTTSSTPPDVPMVPLSKSPQQQEMAPPSTPYPRHVSQGELQVLQDCLHRWRTEVESDVRDLQGNIGALEESISRMYGDEAMTKKPYHLHAVLVHEGQAASGHYWAYIYDSGRGQWLKFNDITVSEASWEELEKESVGGYHNASAYCLMYIDKSHIFTEQGPEIGGDLENLPDDLKEVVGVDNKLFTEEIEKWDRDMQRKAAGGGDGDVTVISVGDTERAERPASTPSTSSTVSTQTTQTMRSPTASTHASLAFSETRAAMRKALELETYQQQGMEDALNNAMQLERSRLESMVASLPQLLPGQDPRLQHMVTYMLHSRCSSDIVDLILLEQFTEPAALDTEPHKKFRAYAINRFSQLLKEGEGRDKHYSMWHERYQTYRKTMLLYIKGVGLYLDEKHAEALSYLLHAHMLSEQLRKKVENGGLPDPKISAFFLRQTLLHINDTITQQFEESSEVSELLVRMNTLVLPCLQTLQTSGLSDDVTAVEEIREKWCSFLGQDIGPASEKRKKGIKRSFNDMAITYANKVEQLQDFLSKLFEPPLDLRLPKMPSFRAESYINIHKQYAAVMESAQDCGYIDRALKTS